MLGFAVSGGLGLRGHQQAPPTGQTISAPTVTRRTARVELTRSQLVQERSLLARPTLSSYGNFLARSARTGPTSGTRAWGRFDPFAFPSWNVRSLRIPAGWSRRQADITDLDSGRRSSGRRHAGNPAWRSASHFVAKGGFEIDKIVQCKRSSSLDRRTRSATRRKRGWWSQRSRCARLAGASLQGENGDMKAMKTVWQRH